MTSSALISFSDQAARAQAAFRAIMSAMARPGRIETLAPWPHAPRALMPASAAIAGALFDNDTPVWLDPVLDDVEAVRAWIRFETNAPITNEPRTSHFALLTDLADDLDLECFAWGSDEYPDRSTTLIVETQSLTEGTAYRLQGPGIDGMSRFAPCLGSSNLFDRLAVNQSRFPRGLDLLLVAGDQIAAVPRSTRLTREET